MDKQKLADDLGAADSGVDIPDEVVEGENAGQPVDRTDEGGNTNAMNGSAPTNNVTAESVEPTMTQPENSGEAARASSEEVEQTAEEEVTGDSPVVEDSPAVEGQAPEQEAAAQSDTSAEPETSPEPEAAAGSETPPEPETIDYSAFDKTQLLDAVVGLLREDDVQAIIRSLSDIKKRFDQIEEQVRKDALAAFEDAGGDKDAFDYQPDEETRKFLANYQLLRDRRQKYYKELERQKESNLKSKNDILERLREIVDGEETVTSIKIINEIREQWRSTGPIPRQFNKTLWANYNALMDRFYDNRSIYFELKELDRKKNLELKIELCERAEALVAVDELQKAVNDLNALHDDFKHIGPVPLENQEELWLRFKAASDTIYARRKVYIDEIKDQLQANLTEKTALCDAIEALASFNSDRITEWNDKTKEVQELQKKWEAIGGLPRDKSKTVNRRFWSSFKGFFNNKNKFFKTLEGQKEGNLELKEALVKRAEELKDSTDFNKTADQFKKLQQEWREIGPVPEKVKNQIYKKFKAACDEFFERKRASVKESEKEYEANLVKKNEVCDQLEEIAKSDKLDLDLVESLQMRFAEIGFVPRNSLKKINQRYNDVLGQLKEVVESSELSNKEQVALEIDIRMLKGRPGSDRQMQKQENNLRRQISTIENNISTWRNNLEFFRDSKTAEKFKKEFDVKISAANEELKQLKKQLRMMETA